MTAIGALLLAASAYSLIIGISTDAIPAKWPFEPKSRKEHPEAFRFYLFGWSAAGVVGAVLVTAGLLTA